MSTLGPSDFLKAGTIPKAAHKNTNHPYFGKTRLQIIKLKIKDGKPFALGKDGKGGNIYGLKVTNKWIYELQYAKKKGAKAVGTIKVNKIFKDDDFGGGGGSGGGAADTEVTESLQCYYTSVLYNGTSTEWESIEANGINKKILKKYEKYCDASVLLQDCLKNIISKPALKSWIETDPNVFVKTANKINDHRYAGQMTGDVYFHRGSKFMKSIYERRKRCMEHDKKIALQDKTEPIAPASFSDDKWNPGDIWMSTLPKASKHPFPDNQWEGELGVDTCDWSALKNVVFHVAEQKETIGVSLKKVTSSGSIKEFNLPKRLQNKTVKYLGFTFGQTGNFFGSADIYVYFQATPGGYQAIQWRAFDSVKSWQGEIKGASAAGGKIGGGGSNYFCEKYFKKSIGSSTNKHGKWQETLNPDWKDAFRLYTLYNNKQLKREIKGEIPATIKTQASFTKEADAYLNNKGKNTPTAFKFGKYMGLLFLDTIIKGGPNKKDKHGMTWATDTFRYASSNIDISSYFIKIY